MENVTPDHLAMITKPVDSLPGFENQTWFKTLPWKAQLTDANGNTQFQLSYCGENADGLIINKPEHPIIVYATNSDTGEKVTLFDGRVHGYEALLIENFENQVPSKELIYEDEDGNVSFQIYLWAAFNIDFEDEYPGEKQIKLINGSSADIGWLQKNAFDAFGIIVKNKQQHYFTALELELA